MGTDIQSDKRVSLTLSSTVESINIVERIAEALARISGFDCEECYEIRLAIREAATNAVSHGNAYDSSKHMTVAFATSAGHLVITIGDEGGGFDVNCVPDPLADENLFHSYGRGLLLIRSFMDEVRFRNLQPGTEVTLLKRRHHSQSRAG
jgi:serine/threonine-protein kinase RsbW